MNTNPSALHVLCFGDSNTWGRNPQGVDVRYPANVRWTGILQTKLGENFEVIEEGLQGRTTNLDDPNKEGRNGQKYLQPCLLSHNPLDLVIVMLGTNDMKEKFGRSPAEIAEAIRSLIQLIKATAVSPSSQKVEILIVVPPPMREDCFKQDTQFRGAGEKSQLLAGHIETIAQAEMVHMLDLAAFVQSGDADGVHFDKATHRKIADVVSEKVQVLCLSS
jgi:lysophospholipase L1-like esterase